MKDGGPSFPVLGVEYYGGGVSYSTTGGMSLRDYFAAVALTGAIYVEANDTLPDYLDIGVEAALDKDAKRRAEWCYRQADAMLSARSRKGE